MTGIAGKTVGNHDGRWWGRQDFQAGRATGQTQGYDTLSAAVEAAAEIEGAEVISAREGSYYLNEIRGTHYTPQSQSEVTIRARELVRGADGQNYTVVGFLDDNNRLIAQYDSDENLEMMGQAADVQRMLDLVGEDLGIRERMTILGAASGIDSPRLMSNMQRISAALQRMPAHLPAELREKVAEMVKPENLAMVAGVLAVWAGSHAVGVGQAVDTALLVGGLAFLGVEALDVAQNLYDFATVAVNASTDAELDSAARSLADGVATTLLGGASAAAGLGAARVAGRLPGALPAATRTPDLPDTPPRTADTPGTPSHAAEMPELHDRAEFQRYVDSLTHGMEKPVGTRNAELTDLIGKMYRDNAEIGSGSTADALRFERETGVRVGGVEHTQKAQDSLNRLRNWVENPAHARDSSVVSSGDYHVALRLIADLENALQTPPLSREAAIQRLTQYLNDFPNGSAATRESAVRRLAELYRQ